MAKETAEQKLLKLIESTDKESVGTSPEAPSGAQEAQKTLNSVQSVGVPAVAVPPFLVKILSLFRGAGASGGHPAVSFGLKEMNRILVVVVAVILLFFISDFRKGFSSSKVELQFDKPEGVSSLSGGLLPEWKDLSEYVSVVQERNIFQPYEKKVVEVVETPAENQRINQKVVGLKLVGVSWLDSPESVTIMVEDENTSVTHFLMAGDELRGVKVDAIYSDRVTLSYQGETVDISL